MSETQLTYGAGGGEEGEGSNSVSVSSGHSSSSVTSTDIKLDSGRSAASGSPSTSRPSSQQSTARPSVTFVSPRTLAVKFLDSARSDSFSHSINDTPGSTSAPSSSRLPVVSSAAHFELELALQRSEFEQRLADFERKMSVEQAHAECASYREQVAAMSEQLAVQELFMACQRVELAHFYQQRQREEQQYNERARMESERQSVPGDEERSRTDSAASDASSAQSAASDASTSSSRPNTLRPSTPSFALSSVSSVLDAAITSHQQHSPNRSSALHSVTSSPFGIRPSSSSSSPSSSRPTSAAVLSPRRAATAASSSSSHSAFSSPFVSSAARSASVLSNSSLPPYQLSSTAGGGYPYLSSAASVSTRPSQSSIEPALADVLSMTESLLAQTDESLEAERSKCDALQSTITDMQRRAAATTRQYDADTAEIREQLRIRAAVCTKQEEALHRLTFENHSLVQQIIQLQQLLHSQPPQQPTHPTRPMQPSSHHLPAATHTQQSFTTRQAVGMRDKGGGLFPAVPSASPSTSVTTGRLSKSRFVQPPTAVALANGFYSDSSHASPISTAALGWSVGWKSYSNDNSAEHDESKEQMSLQWPVDKLDANNTAAARAPLMLFPPLQSHHRSNSESTDADKQPHILVSDNAEIVIAASPLAATGPEQLHSMPTTPSADSAHTLSPSHSVSAASSLPTAAASTAPSSLVHVATPTLQPPANSLSPDQLHLHAQFHRPPLPTHSTQPPRILSALRYQTTNKVTGTRPAIVGATDLTLTLQATTFTGCPPAAIRRSLTDEQTEGVMVEQQSAEMAAAPTDESEQGWIVEASSGPVD